MVKSANTLTAEDDTPKLINFIIRSIARGKKPLMLLMPYTASRNALGVERACKMIMYCFNSRAQEADMNDFSLLLDTINDEGE